MNMNKEKRKELQTRREFFKKAAKGLLPIIAGVTLTGCDTFLTAFRERLSSSNGGRGGYSEGGGDGYGESSGCGYTCSGGCSGGCDGTCRWGCETTCKGSCTGSSEIKHYGN